jgi:two-component system response regulator RegX3
MAHGKRTILMVEDEPSITTPLTEALEREGFESAVARTAEEGISLAADLGPELVLLDVTLPDGSGFDVCRELRRDSEVPIIMLTARGEETDRIVGLEVGADDYVVKPFSARELVARIRAVLRRARPAEPPAGDEALEVGDVRLDPARHEVTHSDEPVEVTRKEFEVLRLLMRNAGTVVSREQLIEDVWDANWFGPTKTLDVHVSALRKKLGDDPASPRYVHTVRGVGFRFAAPAELASEGSG